MIALVIGVGGAAGTLVDVLAPARAQARGGVPSSSGAPARAARRAAGAPRASRRRCRRRRRRRSARSRSGLIASTVRAARTPTVWLNLPLAPMLTNRRGAIDAAGDADLAGARQPALVGDLAGRAELGAEQRRAAVRARRTSSGGDTLADADDGVRLGEHVEVVVARAREDADATARGDDGVASTSARRRRRGGRGVGSTPARTVAIWTARRAVDRGDELTAERRLPRDEPIVVDARARPRRR